MDNNTNLDKELNIEEQAEIIQEPDIDTIENPEIDNEELEAEELSLKLSAEVSEFMKDDTEEESDDDSDEEESDTDSYEETEDESDEDEYYDEEDSEDTSEVKGRRGPGFIEDDDDEYLDDDFELDEYDDIEDDAELAKKRRRRTVWSIVVLVLLALYLLVSRVKVYTEYRTISSTERQDSAATHFIEYKSNVLKYSNDGASYTDASDVVLWNQGFEMQNPIVSVAGDYIMFADRQGKNIYLLTDQGLQSKVESSMPIVTAEVSKQGTSAVLMEDGGISYIALYNRNGDELAEGAIHIENGGTPLDIALSSDGKRLAISLIDLTEGVSKTTIRFYDFGENGRNKRDNIVAEYSYENTIIPNIVYVSDERMLAFGDNGVYTFIGENQPAEENYLPVDKEIQTVFYDEKGFGLVFANGRKNVRRYIEVYDVKCRKKLDIDADISYGEIFFMNNHDICMYNERECVIYKQNGRKKFQHEFDNDICGIVKGKGYRNYYFLLKGETSKVRLKVF